MTPAWLLGSCGRKLLQHALLSLLHSDTVAVGAQGTLTHMAPELLTDGHASKASDVYAFGIVMWELATGGRAFAGTPRALLGHQIAQEKRRPAWPMGMAVPCVSPFAGAAAASQQHSSERQYIELAERCWAHDASARCVAEQG